MRDCSGDLWVGLQCLCTGETAQISLSVAIFQVPLKPDDLVRLQERLAWIREHFGVKRIGVFGSVARGDEAPSSDIDILVEFTQGQATFQNFMDLIRYLELLFGRRVVDLVTTTGIDPYLRLYVEDEVIWCEA
ncbi:putative nucleotidyltransferase [Methanofollis sp. W23]|nr:putative nucleotidyltransferase [Methanofollis sp. W23]